MQERLSRWLEKREKGKSVKAGFARVRIDGIWVRWEKIERDEAKRQKE